MLKFWFSLFSLTIITSLFGQDIESIQSSVSLERVKAHLTFLASDELKGRYVGTNGIETAAMYLKTQLMSFGLQPAPNMDDYFQDVPLEKSEPPKSGTIAMGDQTFTFPDDFVVLGGDDLNGSYSFEFVDFNEEEHFKNDNLKDKIVVSICGDGETKSVQGWFYNSAEKVEKLQALGAKGLIELYQSNQVPYKFLKQQFNRTQMSLGEEESEDFFHVWLNASDENKVMPLKNGGDGEVTLEITENETIWTKNVVGFVEGTDPKLKDEYIIYTAHYDHVGIGNPDANQDSIYNGARDNAVGVTAVLEAARYIAAHPNKRSSIFVLFTAEEEGLLGSSYFVDHAPVALDQIVYNFNIDNGGYNDTTIVSVVGLERTTAEDYIQDACNAFGLEGIEDPAKEQGLFDRSDNVNFAKKGIPAPTFSLGFRSFDAEIFKYYHQPGDEVESLNFDYLLKYFRSYTLSSVKIGNSEKAPFWVEGDKYYDAGVELYERE